MNANAEVTPDERVYIGDDKLPCAIGYGSISVAPRSSLHNALTLIYVGNVTIERRKRTPATTVD